MTDHLPIGTSTASNDESGTLPPLGSDDPKGIQR